MQFFANLVRRLVRALHHRQPAPSNLNKPASRQAASAERENKCTYAVDVRPLFKPNHIC